MPEPFPVPPWSDPAVHEQATECVVWIRAAMDRLGFDEPVFLRREGHAGELVKLVATLDREMRARRQPVPDIIWVCLERLRTTDMTARDRWTSVLGHSWHIVKNFGNLYGRDADET